MVRLIHDKPSDVRWIKMAMISNMMDWLGTAHPGTLPEVFLLGR